MRLGILLLALVGSCCALQCNIGSLLIKDQKVVAKSVQVTECDGICGRTVVDSDDDKHIVLFSCVHNSITVGIAELAHPTCSEEVKAGECHCTTALCNHIADDLPVEEDAIVGDSKNGQKCYVGYWANNTNTQGLPFSLGDEVQCAAGSACGSMIGFVSGYDVEVYFCTPDAVCASIGGINQCSTIPGTAIQGCCCDNADNCNVQNSNITIPQNVTHDGNLVNCYQGFRINDGAISNGDFYPCYGDCASVLVSTTLNGAATNVELFTCDPVDLCNAAGLRNRCGSIDNAGSDTLLQGCCCGTSKCIDPTVNPPVYPAGSPNLKCFTGVALNNNVIAGAEMYCDGMCASINSAVNGTQASYYFCATQFMCNGIGLRGRHDCVYAAVDSPIHACCCNDADNCNVDHLQNWNVSTPVVTSSYPIVCYNGLFLNGQNVADGGYQACQGECAYFEFNATVSSVNYNAEVYACDSVTVCKGLNMTTSCNSIAGIAKGCCCGDDLCFDPNRNRKGELRCYAGIYVQEDNYLAGGEMVCDGWCASVSAVVTGKHWTSFWCSPIKTCHQLGLGFGGNDNCNTLPNAPTFQGCCCSDSNNCNVPDPLKPNVTSLPVRRDPAIVCYNGLWLNGNPLVPGSYGVCNGDCVSVLAGTKLGDQVYAATLYTCDPSAACNAYGLMNNCSTVDGTVTTCCCNTDSCIDPNFNRVPGTVLKCYVGVESPQRHLSYGTEMDCPGGQCVSFSSSLNGFDFQTFHCVDKSICAGLGLDNNCNEVYTDRNINACCCDDGPNCNLRNTTIQPGNFTPVVESPIACFSGFYVNDNLITDGKWLACQGDCASISINTTFQGNATVGTLYTCDPVTLCRQEGVENRCAMLEPGIEACCCTDSACLDPTKTPKKKPTGPLTCYVGLQTSANGGIVAGSETYCNGQCGTISANVGGGNATIYACMPQSTCRFLEITEDNCGSVPGDRELTACCCNNVNNCNILGTGINATGQVDRRRPYPITCYNGLQVNGRDVVPGGWAACEGDCVSIGFNTTYRNQSHAANFFTCDPASVCYQLGNANNCTYPQDGVEACCCDTNVCIDPTVYPPKKPGFQRKCYMGLYSTNNLINVGAEGYCNGYCGSFSTTIGSGRTQENVTAFVCAPEPICRGLSLYDNCDSVQGDRDLVACCCNNADNCNVDPRRFPNVHPSPNVPSRVEYPITCYNGVFLNGVSVTNGDFYSCNGDCVAVSVNSTMGNGTTYTLTTYSCDPSSICSSLNVSNSCGTVETGVDFCCCSSNGCIDPTKNPPRTPANRLKCYVGVRSTYNNLNIGNEVYCDGQCGSISGVLGPNNDTTTTYHCLTNSVCQGLQLNDACRSVPGDSELTACCCDNVNNCNVNDTSINTDTDPVDTVDAPIACWTGLTVNGAQYGNSGFQSCAGQCSSMTFRTTIRSTNHSATIYACDPVTLCRSLNMTNTCVDIQPGLSGCCCDYDGCLNPTLDRTDLAPLTCYVGIKSKYVDVGAEMVCDGYCASLNGLVGSNNDNVTTYHCIQKSICKSLGLYNQCGSLPGDRGVTGCCCENKDNCNVKDPSINPTNSPQPLYEYPIVCYTGAWLDGRRISDGYWQVCNGDCAAMTMNTTYQGTMYSATLYGCDPTAVCRALNITNRCAQVEDGVGGCCCNSNNCLDPYKPDRKVGVPLKCYVGVKAPKAGIDVGAIMDCDGKCGYLNGIVNGDNATIYNCLSNDICASLGLNNQQQTLPGDRAVNAFCCDYKDNCNVYDKSINTSRPVEHREYPIVCWNGIHLNGNAITDSKYLACDGQCVSFTLNTTLNGQSNSATVYSCDPTAVCQGLNLADGCANLEDSLRGCCCDTDACVTPWRSPDKKQKCFVGAYASYNNFVAGNTVYCDGMCASFMTNFPTAKDVVKTYHCVPRDYCKTVGLDNDCKRVYGDADVSGCCCDGQDDCNVWPGEFKPDLNVTTPTDPVIACYNALQVNGMDVYKPTFSYCQGMCAKISFNTTSTLNGASTSNQLDFYTCDSSAVCSALGAPTSGACQPVDGTTVSACCCGTDVCLKPNMNDGGSTAPPPPATTTSSSSMFNVFALLVSTVVYSLFLRK